LKSINNKHLQIEAEGHEKEKYTYATNPRIQKAISKSTKLIGAFLKKV